MGEDFYGIAATHLDSIYLSSGRDYTLELDQLAKAKVGVSGVARDLTKAGTVTLRLKDGDNTATLTNTNTVKGIDLLQLQAIDDLVDVGTDITFNLSGRLSVQLQVVTDVNSSLARFTRSIASNVGGDGVVSEAGEWTFVNGADVLTLWNGAVQSITLVGVASVTADGSSTLKVMYDPA